MKKRFLPFSLLLVIMILGQSVMADQVGHYVPRVKNCSSAEAFISSMRVNQHTGMIDPAWLIAAAKQSENNSKDYADIVYWHSMGPDNLGGRTTSIIYSLDHPKWAYIGSMGGGVYFTWNDGISWHQVGENLMVSCMAQAADGTIYVGTGDGDAAVDYNGLADIGHENSFLGSGLYAINPADNSMTLVEGTSPVDNTDPAGEWSFINDVAVDGDLVIVATSDGLRYLEDGEWKYARYITEERGKENLVGLAVEVKVAKDHTIVASVDGNLYIGTIDDLVCKSASSDQPQTNPATIVGLTAIGTAAGLLDIAVAPSDENVIYAASINARGNHAKIYCSQNKGESWNIILPSVNANYGHQVYGERGLYNHGLVVDPENPDRLYVLGYDLWLLEKPTSDTAGYYMALQLSSYTSLHTGINAMAFYPKDHPLGERDVIYIGTDGGIYKAVKEDATYLSFVNCNRGYITTRCLAVAPSGKNTRVVGGILDHGAVLIEGQDGLNNMETGELLYPELTGAHFGAFDDAYNAGPCAVSVIQPKAIIITINDEDGKGRLHRTEDGGLNYDFANFAANLNDGDGPSYSGYRMPIAYWECFDDDYSVNYVWFKCKMDQQAGDTVQVLSDNGKYPFDYVVPFDMHYDTVSPLHSDSVLVRDPLSTKLVVASKKNNDHEIYYTLDGIRFDRTVEWYKIATISAYPTCMTFSADGDNLFIGTGSNSIYRISNLRQAVDENSLAYPDSSIFVPEVTLIELPVSGQMVTSLASFTDDANKLVVTLGNYGNDNYVLYSNNALSDTPSFSEKQGEGLPKMPVYSSVFTSTYDGHSKGHVLIGTDHGVYRTTDITASTPVWTLESDNMGDVPVLDLKQQLISQEERSYTTYMDGEVVGVTNFPATNNQGVIYAATYGRGLFRCETYRQESSTSVPETPAAIAQSKLIMYPNPVRDEAKISFELNNNAMVSYQVYDMSGRMVKMETLGNFVQGKHEANVDVNGIAKGAYVLRLNAGSYTASVKFMVF